jgi:molybdopterin/thiamine biosynthesis adenylyltransferase/molybdopterin synthase catalytic subunit/rhodanese-related sulfurtransferase
MAPGFAFSSTALDLVELRASVQHIAHGGYASFEGWVRNHNEGSAVTALEYEAFEKLAVKEGERIIAEACERYGVSVARCVHRVGALALGDVAVWVGVSAPHRDEAFKACRYIIDEVKHRVPIWKKEHYVNGDSGWVNCERCAAAPSHQHDHDHDHGDGHAHDHANHEHAAHHAHHAHGHQHGHDHAHPHSATAAGRTPSGLVPDYSRQTALAEIGPGGQARLAASHVAVIGAGGLGVPVLQYLAGAGVGQITIIDGDRLEPSNLHRQTWYALADCGALKAELAAQRVRALNPTVQVRVATRRLDAHNAAELIGTAQILVDCSDNFATQFLVNDLARELGRTAVLASIYQYEGQLQVVRGDGSGPCLRCVWPEATRDGVVGNCAEAGVLGPVPGVLGSLQALRVIELIVGLPQAAADSVVMLDLRNLTLRAVRARRCTDCGERCARCSLALAAARATTGAGVALEVGYATLAAAAADGYQIIDIREPAERAAAPLAGPVTAIAMQELLSGRNLPPDGRYLFVCARGQRSLAVAQHCQERGLCDARSLRGGVAALSTQLAPQG